jgi:nicotinamide-nucleotide amidase
MRAELLTIGSELTSGATVNTNAALLARRLAELGIVCQRCVTVSDERAALVEALQEAMARCELLLTTGGLGPTFDDVTIEAVAEATHRPLRYDAAAATAVRRFYRRSHRALQRAALRQAYLPAGAAALPNPVGTAPGMWLALPDTLIIALPGVPGEMRAILEQSVLPRLKRMRGAGAVVSRTLRTAGLVELSIQAMLRRLRLPPGLEIGLYPHLRMVDVRLTVPGASSREATRLLGRTEDALRARLGAAVYGVDGDTLEGVIGELLVRRHRTLAVAESCTGGLVCDRLTDVPGSSRYLRGGLVAYHNHLKRGCLGVRGETLARFGAVSAPTVIAMADGVRRLAGADIGLSISGIAGPTGGTARKPVGSVWIGLADSRRTRTRRFQFFGDRLAIKTQAAQAALDWLRRSLLTA